MKNVIIIILILLGFKGYNQTQTGTTLLGGNISMLIEGDDGLLNINPNFGYLIANNVALGCNLNYVNFDGDSFGQIGPYVRVYFGPSENNKFFLQTQGSYVFSNHNSSIGLGIKAGNSIFLNKFIALEISLGIDKIIDANTLIGTGIGFLIHYNKDNNAN